MGPRASRSLARLASRMRDHASGLPNSEGGGPVRACRRRARPLLPGARGGRGPGACVIAGGRPNLRRAAGGIHAALPGSLCSPSAVGASVPRLRCGRPGAPPAHLPSLRGRPGRSLRGRGASVALPAATGDPPARPPPALPYRSHPRLPRPARAADGPTVNRARASGPPLSPLAFPLARRSAAGPTLSLATCIGPNPVLLWTSLAWGQAPLERRLGGACVAPPPWPHGGMEAP